MRFHLLSDLHMELGEQFALQKAPCCDALILAGDNGSPSDESYTALGELTGFDPWRASRCEEELTSFRATTRPAGRASGPRRPTPG